MTKPKLSFTQAARQILRERGPMHYKALMAEILAQDLVQARGSSPDASLNAMITVALKRQGEGCDFVRLRPGVYGLRESQAPPANSDELPRPNCGSADEQSQQVRTPYFPFYSEVRTLLKIWQGRNREHITGLRAKLLELSGTPQQSLDWSTPDRWIPERLTGNEQELAQAIWRESKHKINPRYTYGHWLMSQRYQLLDADEQGTLRITERGTDFLDHPQGDAVSLLDEHEGLSKILSLIADHGPVRSSGILEAWTQHVLLVSSLRSSSTIRAYLASRIKNLMQRELIEKKGVMYSISDSGLSYLNLIDSEEYLGGDEQQQIRSLVKDQEASVRDSLRELLLDMDPFAFEHLAKRLMEHMGYENVEVTTRSGDGGVDVIADIELGISSVREVVQAKRHSRTIQRKDLDALRGSLYRFNAVRGTIISTSNFSKGTREAAFAGGAAPITLIDGDKLIDLLIEHGIGVHKKSFEVLSVDPYAFADLDVAS